LPSLPPLPFFNLALPPLIGFPVFSGPGCTTLALAVGFVSIDFRHL
jgi:hypothetical protein